MVITSSKKLGIIAGSGKLPLEIARYQSFKGVECYLILIEGSASFNQYSAWPHKKLYIGKVQSAIDYFKSVGVIDIVFAGGVKRPELKNIKADLTGSILLSKILCNRFLGDDQVLKTIRSFFESYGFNILSTMEVMCTFNKDTLTKKTPKNSDLNDIELGLKVLKAIGNFDIGQSIIIEDGVVLGIEAAEGTDNLIARCSKLRKKAKGGVLVKTMKTNQDPYLDIPTIGPTTINNLSKYYFDGVAIEKNKVIILDIQKTLNICKNKDIFLMKI